MNSTLSVKIKDTEDIKRTFKVEKDEHGWISIGTGSNTECPQIKIHPNDIQMFIGVITEVSKTELPVEL